MTGADVIARLQAAGFVVLRQKGSHVRLEGPRGQKVTVPVHGSADIPRGTLANIARQSGLAVSDFLLH